MADLRLCRWTAIFGFTGIALFLLEFPFYLYRGEFPAMREAWKLVDYSARNAHNILACVLLDLFILGFLMVFLAGLREIVQRADARQEWLGTLFFGAGVVYITLTLIADALQAATVVNSLSEAPDATIIRTMMDSMYLMYGSIALFLLAMLMAAASAAIQAGGALPRWTAWTGYVCATVCAVFIPSMLVGTPDVNGFYNPIGWGPLAIAAGFPLAAWVVAVSTAMLRTKTAAREPVAIS